MTATSNTRLSTQAIFGYCPHTSVSGETWQCIKNGETTSNGAAGGTTIIDTGGDSGGAGTYIGDYWVEILTGSYQGQWKRIVADDGAGTLTLENNGFDGQIVSSVDYRIWLSPEPVLKVTTSTSTTEFKCAGRIGEGDDAWNGYYAGVIYASDNGGTSPTRSEIQQITDFNSADGTFTTGAFSNAPLVRDVLLIRKFVEIESANDGLTEDWVARVANRVNFSRGDGSVGARGGTFGFSAKVRVNDSSDTGDGTKAPLSSLSGLLPSCGYVERVPTAGAVSGAGSTTTTIDIDTATHERFNLGDMIIWNGNPAFITDKTDGAGAADTLTVTPALPVAPATADVIYTARSYAKSTDGDVYGCTLEWEEDGVRTTMTGCKGNAVFADDMLPSAQFELNVDHWIQEIEAAPYSPNETYTGNPVQSIDRKAYLSTTATNISGFTASLNTTVVPRPVQGSVGINGRAAFQLTDYAAGGTWQELLDSDTTGLPQLLRWTARTSKDLIVVYGAGHEYFAVRIPAARHMEVAKKGNTDTLLSTPNVFEAQDAGLTNTADGDTKDPDFIIFLT